MSASAHSFPQLPRGPDVLGELLHSMSQPLTSLRCSLELSLVHSLEPSRELSIEEVAEQQQESVAVALQQTEEVIGMVQLMREYLDAEQPGLLAYATALAPVMRSVIEELSSIAAVRGIQVRLVGTCTATLPVPEARLRLALQYLIAPLIEAQPEGGKVMLLLGQGPEGTVLRAEGDGSVRDGAASASALGRVRLAIASRVLATAGASLRFGEGDHARFDSAGGVPAGFVLRIPRQVGASAR